MITKHLHCVLIMANLLPVCPVFVAEAKYTLDELFELVGADCWAFTTTKDGVQTIHFNTYKHIDNLNGILNPKHPKYVVIPEYEEENVVRDQIIADSSYILKNEPDEIEVYMFGDETWKVVATKTESGYDIKTWASNEKFLNCWK